jgi:hypothetical protein
VQSALRIVEQHAGHTSNTLGALLDRVPLPKVPENASLEQLLELFATLGFDEEAVWKMARADFDLPAARMDTRAPARLCEQETRQTR